MAFDGIMIACVVRELDGKLVNARVSKIAQPEKDELILTLKQRDSTYKLLLSADSSLPLIYLTESNKQAPMTAPVFCMLLRKHLQNAKLLSVTQPGLERAVELQFEHYDELGDLCKKTLVIEIMGKHSNIIFLNDDRTIIDSIKRIPASVSSVREVLPGRNYFIPDSSNKMNPLTATIPEVVKVLQSSMKSSAKTIYQCYTGIATQSAEEICYRAGVDSAAVASELDSQQMNCLAETFTRVMSEIRAGIFSPVIVYEGKKPVDFGAFGLTSYDSEHTAAIDSASDLLSRYYAEKNRQIRVRQRSAELRHIVQTALERNVKKLDLQTTQQNDTVDRDQYRIYGELLNAYGYGVEDGAQNIRVLNYYTNEELTIALDPRYSVRENSKRYFDRYQKLKRTNEALIKLIEETQAEVAYLESVQEFLEQASGEEELNQIREELIQNGYIRRKAGTKIKKQTAKPLRYRSSDGFEILVGKNNIQNEELTFQLANGNDWWFHAKGVPGSHVILRSEGKEVPDRTFEEAAAIAAHYSKGREQDKVPIDYTQKKNVKKVAGAKPGFVIYHTNYSMVADTGVDLPPLDL